MWWIAGHVVMRVRIWHHVLRRLCIGGQDEAQALWVEVEAE